MKKIFSEDIELFCKFFFPKHFTLETPQFHKDVFTLYQDKKLDKIALAAPRGHSKSTITDLGYLAWEIVNNRTRFALLISDTYSQAAMFLDTLKAEFESNERLRQFYGNLVTDSWSEGEIVVGETMVKALGAGMKIRGLKYNESRPDLCIIDDLENDEMVESKERRGKLERWFNGAVLPSLAKKHRVIYIGTILHYDSLLAKVLHSDNYTEFYKRTYKAIQDDGTALWPEHLNLIELEKIKQDFITKGQGFLFYQEYQNDPISDENRKFKIEKFRYYDENDLAFKSLSSFITIDRAYSLEKTADSTGIVVISVDDQNNWFVRLAERFKGTERDLIEKIFNLKSYFTPKRIGIEQKAFEYTIKPALTDEMRKRNEFFTVEELKDLGKAKTVRIEGLVPRFECGTVFFKRDQTDLIDELIKFPKAKHDDLADALSYQLTIATYINQNVAKQYIPSHLR